MRPLSMLEPHLTKCAPPCLVVYCRSFARSRAGVQDTEESMGMGGVMAAAMDGVDVGGGGEDEDGDEGPPENDDEVDEKTKVQQAKQMAFDQLYGMAQQYSPVDLDIAVATVEKFKNLYGNALEGQVRESC